MIHLATVLLTSPPILGGYSRAIPSSPLLHLKSPQVQAPTRVGFSYIKSPPAGVRYLLNSSPARGEVRWGGSIDSPDFVKSTNYSFATALLVQSGSTERTAKSSGLFIGQILLPLKVETRPIAHRPQTSPRAKDLAQFITSLLQWLE